MDMPGVVEVGISYKESVSTELARLRVDYERLRVENEALKKQLLYDPFFKDHTQLAETVLNRAGINKMFGHELERIKRHGKLTFLALDLNRFKEVNDTYGHKTGDRILISAALAIHESIRTVDLIGRPGGDEFIVGLVDADKEEALEVAQRIQEHLLLTVKKDLSNLPISQKISIGITQAKENDQLEDLSERADKALYKAKRAENYIITG